MVRATAFTLACALLISCDKQDTTKADDSSSSDAPKSSAGAKPVKGDGPFGLNLRAGADDLDIKADTDGAEKGFYLLNSVPSPSSDFETYAAFVYPGVGICEIRAVSRSFASDQYGNQATALADSLASALTTKYGPPKKSDTCGSTCEAEFFTMSINQGGRYYGYEWERPAAGESPIRSITVSVGAQDIVTPFVRLDYETGDKTICKKAADAGQAANL